MTSTESFQTGSAAPHDGTERPADHSGSGGTDQVYVFGAFAFSVRQARRILLRHPRPAVQVSTVKWAANFGLTWTDSRINREYALNRADINDPVFVGMLEPVDGSAFHVVFDGCHRLYRAMREARLSVPGYGFTLAESRQILAAGAFEVAAHLHTGDRP